MHLEDIIKQWDSVRFGSSLSDFTSWFGWASAELEDGDDPDARRLSLDIRLAYAEHARGDLTQAELVEEINAIVPGTAAHPLRSMIGAGEPFPTSSEAVTQMEKSELVAS